MKIKDKFYFGKFEIVFIIFAIIFLGVLIFFTINRNIVNKRYEQLLTSNNLSIKFIKNDAIYEFNIEEKTELLKILSNLEESEIGHPQLRLIGIFNIESNEVSEKEKESLTYELEYEKSKGVYLLLNDLTLELYTNQDLKEFVNKYLNDFSY